MPISSSLSVDRFVVSTKAQRDTVVLQTVFNRYRRSGYVPPAEKKTAAILFLSHGGGHHKEMWEPMIEDLFRLDKGNNIQEAWAMDGLNHGESAILNADAFKNHPFAPVYESGTAFSALFKSNHFKYFNRDIHGVFLVGHSAGGVIAVLSTQYFPGPPSEVPFAGIILIEPAMIPREMIGHETQIYHMVKDMTPMRRDIWESKEAAKAWLQKRNPWSQWDPRVLDIYVEHGLRSLPTPAYPDKVGGVTLATSKFDEAKVFEGTTEALHAVCRLEQIATTVPVHFVFGEREELYPKDVQDALNNPSQGRPAASIYRVAGAGHLIVQEVPQKLAQHIFDIIGKPRTSSSNL